MLGWDCNERCNFDCLFSQESLIYAVGHMNVLWKTAIDDLGCVIQLDTNTLLEEVLPTTQIQQLTIEAV